MTYVGGPSEDTDWVMRVRDIPNPNGRKCRTIGARTLSSLNINTAGACIQHVHMRSNFILNTVGAYRGHVHILSNLNLNVTQAHQ